MPLVRRESNFLTTAALDSRAIQQSCVSSKWAMPAPAEESSIWRRKSAEQMPEKRRIRNRPAHRVSKNLLFALAPSKKLHYAESVVGGDCPPHQLLVAPVAI